MPFDSKILSSLIDKTTRAWHAKERHIRTWEDAQKALPLPKDPLLNIAASVTRINTYQWHEEDKARDTAATDKIIADIKRIIDKSNQRRVDEIERFDQTFEALLASKKIRQNPKAPLNSETPGSLVDRLSILGLKLFHMKEQSARKDITKEQKAKFAGKVETLKRQRKDLGACLDALLREVRQGKRRFTTYFQFKMYNDPETNPFMRKKAL